MRHVVLPAIIPASLGILLSIPFFMRAKRQNDTAVSYRPNIVKNTHTVLTSDEYAKKDKKALTLHIEKTVLHEYFETREWDRNYVSKLLGEVRAKFPQTKQERTATQQTLFDALDEVTKSLTSTYRTKRLKKEREEEMKKNQPRPTPSDKKLLGKDGSGK